MIAFGRRFHGLLHQFGAPAAACLGATGWSRIHVDAYIGEDRPGLVPL
jgi:hypothetical protein